MGTPKKSKAAHDSVRLSSNLNMLDPVWEALPDVGARTNFLSLALARNRLDIIVHFSKTPLMVGDFISEGGKEARNLIAKYDDVDALDAIERLSETAYEALMMTQNPQSFRDFGATAIKKKSLKLWGRLLHAGLDPFSDGQIGTTLCHMAASHGWVDGLGVIERQHPGKLVALVDGSSRSVLHTAARYGQEDVMRWLLALGADFQARDKTGRPPLFSCTLGHTEGMSGARPDNWCSAAAILLQAGARLDDRIGKTNRSATLIERMEALDPQGAEEIGRVNRVFVEAEQLEMRTSVAQAYPRIRRV